MSLSSGNIEEQAGRRKNRRGGTSGLVHDINVTPLVDVMLVLLIVFMVSAPLIVNGVPLDLPETSANALNSETKPLTVSLTADGRIAIGSEYYIKEEFLARLKSIGGATTEGYKQRIIVRGAKGASYGQVLDMLALIQQAGFSNVALASIPTGGG